MSALAQIFAKNILKSPPNMTFDKVPEFLKEQVQALLDEAEKEKNDDQNEPSESL